MMTNSSARLTLVATLLILVQYVAASGDRFFPESFEGLSGNDLCNLKGKRISHISTIKNLLVAFDSSEDAQCRNEWLEPLRELQALLDSSATDACSLVTIDKLGDFHWSYVVGTLSKSWRESLEGTIPEPLRLFFINFAKETMERCKSSVGSRLNEALATHPVPSTFLSGGSLGLVLRTVSVAMVPQAKIKKFDDFFFIYQAIINTERKKGNLIVETIPDPETGEVTYMSVKLNDASKTHELQEKCRQQLRPIYSNTVLPVMKLVDLGFGTKGQKFYHDEQLLAEWYEIAQFCEFMLPVKYYSSQELKKDQVAVVKDPEEIKLLASQDESVVVRAPANVEVSAVALDDALPMADDDSVVLKQVKSSFKSRARVYRKTLKNALSYIKYEVGSRFKKLFVSKKKNGRFVIDHENEADIVKSLNEAEKDMVREETRERDPSLDTSMEVVTRHKREVPNPELGADHKLTKVVVPKQLLTEEDVRFMDEQARQRVKTNENLKEGEVLHAMTNGQGRVDPNQILEKGGVADQFRKTHRKNQIFNFITSVCLILILAGLIVVFILFILHAL